MSLQEWTLLRFPTICLSWVPPNATELWCSPNYRCHVALACSSRNILSFFLSHLNVSRCNWGHQFRLAWACPNGTYPLFFLPAYLNVSKCNWALAFSTSSVSSGLSVSHQKLSFSFWSIIHRSWMSVKGQPERIMRCAESQFLDCNATSTHESL